MAVLGALSMVLGLGGGLIWLVISFIKHSRKLYPFLLIAVGIVGLGIAVNGTDPTVAKFQSYMSETHDFEAVAKRYYAVSANERTDVWTKAVEGKTVKVTGVVIQPGSSAVWVLPIDRYHGQTSLTLSDADRAWMIVVKNADSYPVGHRVTGKVKLTSRGSNTKKFKTNWDGEVQ